MVYENSVCEAVHFHEVQIGNKLHFQIFTCFIISEGFFVVWYKYLHYGYNPCMEKYFYNYTVVPYFFASLPLDLENLKPDGSMVIDTDRR